MPARLASPAGDYRSEAEVTERLQALEARQDLLRFQWKGWSVWPLVRFAAARAFQRLPLDSGHAGFTRREQLGFALKDVFPLLRRRRVRYFVKTYSSAHMELEGGRKEDVFFDELLSDGGTHFKMELPNSRRFHARAEPYLVPPDASSVALDGMAVLLGRRAPSAVTALAAALSEAVRVDPELGSFSPSFLATRIAEFHWAKRLYRLALRRLSPSVVLLADTGDYAVMAAARELGIPVVEFQHGFTHRHFPGNSWSRAAQSYKERMPLPHRLLVYGPHWQRELAANGFWNDELKSVGSLRIDRYRRQPRTPAADGCTFVVTAAGVDTSRLIAFLTEAIRLLRDRVKFQAIIKTHPLIAGRDNDFVAAFSGDERVRVVGGSEAPSTFELLRSAHLHVSIASTCHYEALALGVPTVILPLTGSENVLQLHAAGHASFPQSPAEFADIVQGWRGYTVRREVGDEYFTPGALENIQRELAALAGPAAA